MIINISLPFGIRIVNKAGVKQIEKRVRDLSKVLQVKDVRYSKEESAVLIKQAEEASAYARNYGRHISQLFSPSNLQLRKKGLLARMFG